MSDAPAAHTPARPCPLSARIYILIGILILVAAFWWTGSWMVTRWEQEGSYYSHGWLIPPVTAVLLYLKRKQIRRCPIRPDSRGWLIVVPSLMLHVLGTTAQVGVLSGIALLGLLVGLVLTLFGTQMLRLTFFPLLFLAFMVPVPAYLIKTISFNMKMLAAAVATGIADFFGVVVVRTGSTIHLLSGEQLTVGNVCSGLKYLISLVAFAALYSHLSKTRVWGKAILFAMSVPIAIAANIVRVTLMIVVAHFWNAHMVSKWYFHDLFGFLLFIVAFLLLFLMESLFLKDFRFRRLRGVNEETEQEQSVDTHPKRPATPATRTWPRPRLLVILLVVLGAVTAYSLYATLARRTVPSTHILRRIPLTIGEWQGKEHPLDDRTIAILGTKDVLSRTYRNREGAKPWLYIILSRHMASRPHPPEECLEGEGYERHDSRVLTLRIEGKNTPQQLQVKELVYNTEPEANLSSGRPPHRKIVWYFFKCGSNYNTSYLRHQFGVLLHKFSDPNAEDMMIRADVNLPTGDIEQGRQVLESFFCTTLDTILDKLP